MNNEEKILEMLGQVAGRLDHMDTTLTAQGERLTRLEKTVEELKITQAAQGEQLSRLEETVGELDARSLKSAVLLETDISRDIHLLYEGHSELSRKLDTLATKAQVEELAGDVDVIKNVVSRHSVDINMLKKAQ